MGKIWWIAVIMCAASFFWWIYRDGKFNGLMDKRMKDYRAPDILIILYLMLIVFAFLVSFINLFFLA